MSTSWVIDMSNTTDAADNTTLTPAIYITFTFNSTYWQSFTDVLEIYSGGGNFNGTLSAIGRGNSQNITNFVPITNTADGTLLPANTVVIFGPVATVNFRSYAKFGQHFSTTYFADVCPQGYVAHPTLYCYLPYPYSKGIATAIFALAALSAAAALFSLTVVVIHRSSAIIKSSSFLFCSMILFFILMLSLSSVFYAIPPSFSNSSWLCDIRPWFSATCIVGVLAPLLAKTQRISKIFNSTQLRTQIITNSNLLTAIGGMLLVEITLLAAFSGARLQQMALIDGTGTSLGFKVPVCDSNSGYTPWLLVQLLYIMLFLISGGYTAFKTRDVPSAFNESSDITIALFSMIILATFLLPLNFLVGDNPDALVMIRGIGQCIMAMTMNACLFGPKCYYILTGAVDNTKAGNKTQMGTTGGNNNTKWTDEAATVPTNKQAAKLQAKQSEAGLLAGGKGNNNNNFSAGNNSNIVNSSAISNSVPTHNNTDNSNIKQALTINKYMSRTTDNGNFIEPLTPAFHEDMSHKPLLPDTPH